MLLAFNTNAEHSQGMVDIFHSTRSTDLADSHSSYIEFPPQNPQKRNRFPSVKLSPSLLPNLIATSHISLSSKQLRHNVPIRGNYPRSANCYVIFLHFKSNRIQMFAFCRSNMRTKRATALTYQDFTHTSKEQNLKT